VGDFLRYISKYNNQIQELHPCLIEGEKKLIEFKTHSELDLWHKENINTYIEAASLLKAVHRVSTFFPLCDQIVTLFESTGVSNEG